MVPDAPPPHRLISSTPVDVATGAAMLDTYITNSEAHPHLHPDALITPTGVTFSSHGGPAGGVVMHNLRRVLAGLRGEFLEPEPTPEPEEQGDRDQSWKGKNKKTSFVDETALEWQDKAVYEQEQGEVEVGEIFDRSNVVAEGGEEPVVEVTGGKRAGEAQSKEERKRAKKEKNEQRKRENELKRKKAAEEEA